MVRGATFDVFLKLFPASVKAENSDNDQDYESSDDDEEEDFESRKHANDFPVLTHSSFVANPLDESTPRS
jgi:hypothetical protein